MDEQQLQSQANDERDLMDGAFAVVDREKLIEEETRYITPWYKNFINVFLAPKTMMETCFYEEPPKGMGIGILGAVLFAIAYAILNALNPATKEATFNLLRQSGKAEELIRQTYAYQQVGTVVRAVVGVFISALISAVLLKIVSAIAKDKASFKLFYTISLLSTMVSFALMSVDRLIGNLIPTSNMVLGATVFLSPDAAVTNLPLYILANVLSLPGIWSIVILIIGYSVATRASMKKSTIVVVILEVVSTLVSIGIGMALMGFATGAMNGAI